MREFGGNSQKTTNQEEGRGLMGSFPQVDYLSDALQKRREKIATKRIGIGPESTYNEPDLTPDRSSL